MADEDDRALVEAVVRSGDARAFGALYDRHTPYLYRFALRLTGGDDALAEDAVHDAWMVGARSLSGFAWRSSFRTWLSGIVLRTVLSLERALGRFESWGDDGPEGPGADPPEIWDRIDLERGITSLPPGARSVFVLHDVEGWTHEAIAGHLGIAPGTSKSQLARARAALKKVLEPPGAAS